MLMSIFLHGLNLFFLFLNWCRLSIADFNYQVELLLSLYLLSLFIFWSGCYFSGLSFLCDFLDIHFIFFSVIFTFWIYLLEFLPISCIISCVSFIVPMLDLMERCGCFLVLWLICGGLLVKFYLVLSCKFL